MIKFFINKLMRGFILYLVIDVSIVEYNTDCKSFKK